MIANREDRRMFCYIWEFAVAPEQADAFRRAYGAGGPWVQLFRRAPGYVRTELRRDADNPCRFLTIDYWTTREAYLAFRARAGDEFAAIDSACEQYTENERHVGDFELVDEPASSLASRAPSIQH